MVNDFKDLPAIPPPRLKTVENDTPYVHLAFDKMGKGRFFYDVVVCKATFALAPGKLLIADEQRPIELADRYWDEDNAEVSSLCAAGDVVLTKPSTDILLTGHAQSFDGAARKHWDAGLRISHGQEMLADFKMHLLGPRGWQHSLLRGWNLSDPLPATAIPLRHEHAYGGYYRVQRPKATENPLKTFAANPAGCGYWDSDQLDKAQIYPAPQIESIGQPIKKMGADYPLAAPAPLARFWADRQRYGGTYDDAWLAQYHASPIPDFPPDFDTRFFQCAHPELITRHYLRGDERLVLAFLLPANDGGLVSRLPGIGIKAELSAADGRGGERNLALDTLHIDLDSQTLSLVWRLTLDQRHCIEHVRLGAYELAPESGH